MTSVAIGARLGSPLLRDAGFLGKLGQSVELPKEPDRDVTFACLGHEGGLHSCDPAGDTKAFGFHSGNMLLHRSELLETQLRHAPDAIAEIDEGLSLGVGAA